MLKLYTNQRLISDRLGSQLGPQFRQVRSSDSLTQIKKKKILTKWIAIAQFQ